MFRYRTKLQTRSSNITVRVYIVVLKAEDVGHFSTGLGDGSVGIRDRAVLIFDYRIASQMHAVLYNHKIIYLDKWWTTLVPRG